MKNTKHTQGPWLISGNTIYALNEEGTNVFSTGVQSGFTSQNEKSVTRTSNEEIEANARLIAAAPELLEALEVLESAVRSDVKQHDHISMNLNMKLILAKKEIAKAKGESE